ncbi:Transcriptional repressor tup11-related protein [Tritrichomonas foetus]|uniref:Transcriptional repressor tup11-related protein n=1 Tax=Tritrichomonas foetus TaxID=1144522 RepID=A0A1J4KTH2_9EUKA|nr:Transcriptional repressor tup11-related protein [Tritrichomonas foetus]|eukprot:OHT14192.1 Transcriptional repressor tup11-related protein [Tritrichomonas foetus]
MNVQGIMNVQELRTLFDQLSQEYEYLTDNRTKLEADCNKLREFIDAQVTQIKQLSSDFEKLKADYIQRSNELARAQPNPQTQLQQSQNSQLPIDSQQNYASFQQEQIQQQQPQEEQPEQDWELTTLIPAEKIKKPVIIALLAEIVDISVICSTAFSPDGTCLAIGSDKTIRVYNIEKDDFLLQHTLEETEEGATNHVRSITWTADSQQIFCGGEDGQVRVFKLEGSLVHQFQASVGEVFQVQISHDGSYFATATGDGTLSLFSMTNYQKIASMPRNPSENQVATSLAISHDDRLIAVGYSDNVVIIWDKKTGMKVCEQACHNNGVYSVKFLPEYNRLVSASLDNSVKIWNIVKNEDGTITLDLWKVLDGHTNFVLSLATDPNDIWLLSGSKDLTARLSYIETGEMIYSIKAHSNSVITVAFSPKGDTFCTGSGDQSVKIWSLSPEETEDAE